MSGLRADMFGGNRICLAKQNFTQQKNRSGTKTISVGLDKLTTCKQETIEHI
jgi:hypothetical protein